MQPSTKRIRDNRIAINLNHWEYQCVEALSNMTGIEMATLVRRLSLNMARQLLIDGQPIVYVLPSTGAITIPLHAQSGIPEVHPRA